jgi:hypothetical protein
VTDDLWSFVAALEAQVPLDRTRVAGFLAGAPFRNTFELPSPTSLTVRFLAPPTVDPAQLDRRFSEVSALPPPPPGYGPPEAEGAYVVQRGWGQLWFAFHTGSRLVSISLAVGASGSPGV